MNCSYCGKDMEDLDICPKCGMGKRIEYELFKTDKGERKKDFEDYEKEYLNRLENNNPDEITDNSEPENPPNPNNWNKPTLPTSGGNKGLMILLGLGIPILLGIISGAIMAFSGGGDVTNVYYPNKPQYVNLGP